MAQSGPLYHRIASDLRRAIDSGELQPGAQLPTEQELAARYDVSRNTVRLALGTLANEGTIASTPGRGTFVRDRVVTTYHAAWAEAVDRPASDRADAYHEEVEAQGHAPAYGDFEMRMVAATNDVAARLHVNEGDTLVVRSIVRYVDGEPSSLQDSYYPVDIAQECGLMTAHDIPQGTIRVMADHGHVEVGYVDHITTRMPTPTEARLLRLGAGVPVLIYSRAAYSKERPLRLVMTTFAGDRNRIAYELGDLAGNQPPADQ